MMADFEKIIDSHCHWGPSRTLGTEVTTHELKRQQEASGVTHVVIMPFPSTAIESDRIHSKLLAETRKERVFIPYHYIREDYDREGFVPVPEDYYGGKWHWMRGQQDVASNYKILDDKNLSALMERIAASGKPVIFEEELSFTERFVDMGEGVTLIIPHLGMLGGDPSDFLASFGKRKNIYFDTALGSKDSILKFVKKVGPERVLFGSDVPFGAMKGELSKILSLPISHEDKELILSKNLIRLTGFES
ncbi:MAG TPA: amidohydrolase family protein [Syntrophorhabdaceae bacterium]|jgi:hypothetical protein